MRVLAGSILPPVFLLTLLPGGASAEEAPAAATGIQRVTTAVPWPRGIVWKDGKLLVLARGVHRSAGGPNPEIQDLAGNIFEVDPNVHEPLVKGTPPGEAVRANARLLAEATSPPFHLWSRALPSTSDTLTDRPYAGLLLDEPSNNLFVICFSGIDLLDKPFFRKNATCAVHRYNLQTRKWYAFEAHDPTRVPVEQLAVWVPNDTYPHHDPAQNKPPHGMANGPCGGWIVGKYLYVAAKDNSALVQYDLTETRRNPEAPPPPGRYVFRRSGPQDDPFLETKGHGNMYVEGTCAVAAHAGWMYVAFRTTSQIVRFPITADGDVVRPIVAEYLAQFDAYEYAGNEYTKSADIFDMRINSRGDCFVSCNGQGTLWRIPAADQGKRVLNARKGTEENPYVNLRELTDHDKSTCGNFCFDPEDNVYICTGNEDTPEDNLRGAIYRVPAR
jgi:hypothetical protein